MLESELNPTESTTHDQGQTGPAGPVAGPGASAPPDIPPAGPDGGAPPAEQPAAGDEQAGRAAGGSRRTGGTRARRPSTRATRPAGPPAPESPPPEQTAGPAAAHPAGEHPAGEQTAGPAAASPPTAQTAGQAAPRGAVAPVGFSAPGAAEAPVASRPASPGAPVGFSAPSEAPPVTQPSFLAPQLIFQPPAAAPAAPPSAADPGPAARSSRASRGGTRADGDEPGPAAADTGETEAGADAAEADGRRRRRRGGRGRSKGRAEDNGEAPSQEAGEVTADGGTAAAGGGGEATPGEAAHGAAAEQEAGGDDTDADGDSADGAGRRRRRRRRRGGVQEGDQPAPDDPPDTVVHVREPRPAAGRSRATDEVQGLKGSTRLEAKRQRRREGRDSGRRRPPIITESEFLARREAVDRAMVIRQRGDRTQIAVLEDGVLVEHYVDKTSHQSFVGNVYLGKVQNVLPSMEAAFVDIGKGRNAVLYAGEVNFDASGLEGQTRRIESALKSGQSVLVQVTKDPVGHKGARLTSQVSLPGRYLVYVPGAAMTGISRKLPDTERNRLKTILRKVMPEGAGVIVRTAAEGATEDELAHDVARLSAQWEDIERKAKDASPPELLYNEPDLTIRVVRDIFNEDFNSLVVSRDDDWDMVDEYVRYVAPHLADRLSRWQGDEDVFASYRIDEQLAKALDRKVWLPSGGSLVIDRTEAMTVIDVNTGKFTGHGGNLEETVTRNNLEAAEEIVRQLRLRDIGGIIVIDFIDMVLESNRDLVLRRLLECLARDRTKHQVAEVTSLGLVQMTRKRVGSGLLEAFSVPCECCNGRGLIVSLEPGELASAAHHRHATQDGGAHGTAAGDGADSPGGNSRRRRRKTAAPAGDPVAAGAVAVIAAASAAAETPPAEPA